MQVLFLFKKAASLFYLFSGSFIYLLAICNCLDINSSLLISLRSLVSSGELFLSNTYSTQTAREFFLNVIAIKKYIKSNYYDSNVLIDYANQLPDYSLADNAKLEESNLEAILRNNYRIRGFLESIEISFSPRREMVRNEVSNIISKTIQSTRLVLEMIFRE